MLLLLIHSRNLCARDSSDVYTSTIEPIFRANCFSCHGAEKQKSELRLDSASGVMKGGLTGPAIISGDPDSSLLIQAVKQAGDLKMPPKGKLSDAEISALVEWVKSGATVPETSTSDEPAISAEQRESQWAFQPLTHPVPPEIAGSTWSEQPIDRFIESRLRTEGLTPSPPADRTTLIRRLTFDLIGMVPTPEETTAFIADESPDAVERLVDRLLASPHYGERWAQHWLDVVRFAETNGFETNTPRPSAWPYRDYVIRAFNEDKPYTQFITEQLAGETMGADAATGFMVAGAWDEVKSPDPVLTAQQRTDELHDMVSTTGAAFLGLTVGCARCHNHKFDPISQRDYYSMQAVFAGVEHRERKLKPPDYEVRLAQAAELRPKIDAIDAKLLKFEPVARPESTPEPGSLRPSVSAEYNVERFEPIEARFVRFTVLETNQYEPCIDELEIYAERTAPDQPLRNVGSAFVGGKASASGTYPGSTIHLLKHINDGGHGNSRSWISNETGKGWVQIELAAPTRIDRIVWQRDREGKFKDRLATRYRIEVSRFPPDAFVEGLNPWKVVASSEDRKPYDKDAETPGRFSDLGLPSAESEELVELLLARKQLDNRRKSLLEFPGIYAGDFTDPKPTRMLHRGDPMQPGDEVTPGGIGAVVPKLELATDAPERERRLALARWIADPANPLTARVMVNRIWQHHFGQGIVATPSDFGANGVRPSHPELLDWLASEFISRGWSVKAMHRMIVLSSAYRQSSAPRSDGLARDAGCKLLWRYPPRRLDAEAIHDSILAVSGKLDLRFGGPGYSPFEPNDNYVRVYKPLAKFGPAQWRRMIYQTKVRMRTDGTFGVFDCPDGGQTIPKRTLSTTPLQALNMMNSPFIVQQAELLAERLKADAGQDANGQIVRAFQLAFNRAPDADEARAARELVSQEGLAVLCRALLNTNEFVTLN